MPHHNLTRLRVCRKPRSPEKPQALSLAHQRIGRCWLTAASQRSIRLIWHARSTARSLQLEAVGCDCADVSTAATYFPTPRGHSARYPLDVSILGDGPLMLCKRMYFTVQWPRPLSASCPGQLLCRHASIKVTSSMSQCL